MELVVGRVVKSHGVTGEVVVEIRTDDPADRFAPGTRLRAKGPFDGGAEGSAVSYVIESVRQHGGRLLVRLAGVADRDAADALRGSLFVIDADDLPPIDEPDTYYDHQLVGVGVVTEVVHTAAGELLAVKRDSDEVLVPFVRAIVTSVSLDDGIVEIDPPHGLLNLE